MRKGIALAQEALSVFREMQPVQPFMDKPATFLLTNIGRKSYYMKQDQ
jgi:hypothetical protein